MSNNPSSLSSRLRRDKINKDKLFLIMKRKGVEGVKVLQENTPKETGETSTSWTFKVEKDKDSVILSFHNDEVTDLGIPIPVLIMFGFSVGRKHVPGNNFVRRALAPLIQSLKEEIRKEIQ